MEKIKNCMRTACIMVFAFCLSIGTAFAQTSQVKGRVVDSQGQPIPGVNVVVKGTTTGTITDFDGNYTITVNNPNDVLTFSFIGYNSYEAAVNGQSSVDATLQDEFTELDDVVVVGYGVQKKRDLTGSVSSVNSEDIQQVAAPNVMQAMQAKIPGVDLTQSSGQAGAGINISLRGSRSVSASNDPLIIVDGVEYGSTIDIPAGDIESMDILKDASSTAIYGTKGANGVIIITTKRGKAGKTNVNVNAYWSFNSPTSIVKSMYGDKEVQRWIDRENYKADLASGNWGGNNATAADVYGAQSLDDGTAIVDLVKEGSYTDWYDVIFQNSTTQNYEVSVNGGSENTNFSLSSAVMLDRGLLKNDKMNRYNIRLNVDHKINDYFKTGASLAYTVKDHDARNGGVFNSARKMTSLTHAYNQDGTINETPNIWYTAHVNPLMDEENNYQKNVQSSRFLGSVYLQVTPVEGLSYKSTFSFDRSNSRTGQYQDFKSVSRYQAPSTTAMSNGQSFSNKITWQNIINYNKTFADKHDLGIMLGHEMIKSIKEGTSLSGTAGKEHYYTASFYDLSKILNNGDLSYSSEYTQQQMLSFFGRLNYSFDGKYMVQASLRADGSSVLAEGNKWGVFPSASAGWRLSEESFMEGAKENAALDNLKLRVAWGKSGSAAVSPYQTLATVSSATPSSATQFIPNTMSNPNLTWETTTSVNIGLDFGFLQNRLSGSVDFYVNKTTDLLYPKSAPASSVFASVLSNVGESKGSGIEVMLNAVPVKAGDFTWDINATYTHSKDEIVTLADGLEKNISGTSGYIVGEPISLYYDYEVGDCWGVGEYEKYTTDYKARTGKDFTAPITNYGAPGTIKLIDRNNDGEINEDDKKVYNRAPKHIIGMTNTFSWKGLALSVQMMARLGGWMSYEKNTALGLDDGDANWADVDYWTIKNTGSKIPNPGSDSKIYSTYKTALNYEKADFFKVKDITLSYNFNKSLLEKAHIANAKVYLSMKNFITVNALGDKYDSERGGSIQFPLAKQVVLGLNLTF